jgi:hypothetical protein
MCAQRQSGSIFSGGHRLYPMSGPFERCLRILSTSTVVTSLWSASGLKQGLPSGP